MDKCAQVSVSCSDKDEEDDEESIIKLINFVDNFMSNIFPNSPTSSSSSSTSSSNLSGTKSSICHTVLCYGLKSRRLRMLQFLFGQQIARRTSSDCHLIRSGYLPNLIDRNFVVKHLHHNDDNEQLVEGHYLEFLKIVYLYEHRTLVDHLLRISTNNLRQSLPTALIVDDISHYLKSSANNSAGDNNYPLSAKRARFEVNPSLQMLIQICSLLVETIDYCSSKTRQQSFLVVCVDQNNLPSNNTTSTSTSTTQRDILFQIGRRFFNHKINVDQL